MPVALDVFEARISHLVNFRTCELTGNENEEKKT